MSTKAKVAVVIGRFQIVHSGHIALIKRAYEVAQNVVIIVGSVDKPRTIKDPFTFIERRTMLLPYIKYPNAENAIAGVPDFTYNNEAWVAAVQTAVYDLIGPEEDVVLVGHNKDESSFYLKLFPQWKYEEVEQVGEAISATEYRDKVFGGSMPSGLPDATINFLNEFACTKDFVQLVREHDFIKKYKKAWEAAPYAPTFVTADAIVVCSGHILIGKRKAEPGKGLGAFPGGFVNQKELIFDACLRELKEETRLKVPEAVLRGSLRISRVFDAPTRSLRGRTITHAFLFSLAPMSKLPEVRGGDDMYKPEWVPLHQFFNMRNVMFEDHFDIGINLVGTL